MSPVSARAAGRDRQGEAEPKPVLLAADQHRHHEQQRRDRQILEQQDRETDAAGGEIEAFALGQHRNDDRGRGQRERRADDQRRGWRLAQPESDGAEQQRREQRPAPAQPEHQAPHARQALERQFEPHHEQQEHDAERGDAVDRLDIGQRQRVEPGRAGDETPEAERAEGDARQQKAQHRTDAQAEEQRRDDPRRHKEQQRLLVDGKIDGRIHARLRLRRSRQVAGPNLVDLRLGATHSCHGAVSPDPRELDSILAYLERQD